MDIKDTINKHGFEIIVMDFENCNEAFRNAFATNGLEIRHYHQSQFQGCGMMGESSGTVVFTTVTEKRMQEIIENTWGNFEYYTRKKVITKDDRNKRITV